MIQYSPTYISITPKQNSYTVLLNDFDHLYDNAQYSWITFKTTEEGLIIKECDVNPRPKQSDTITASILSQILQCTPDKDYRPALIIRPTVPVSNDVALTSQIIIPLIDESKGSILAQNQTAEILGDVQKQLAFSNFNCTPKFLSKREDVYCTGYVVNSSASPLLVDIVTQVIQKTAPGLKTFEERSNSNVLLLKDQQYPIAVTIPSHIYTPGLSSIVVNASFRSPGIDAPSFTARGVNDILYIPLTLIAAAILTIGILSVILIKRLLDKLRPRKNGAKKATDV